MIKKDYLKKEILQLLLGSSIFVIVLIGAVFIMNQYSAKIKSVEHNQTQILKQVEFETNKFLDDISNVASYLNKNYFTNKRLLKDIVDLNSNISSILILSKDGIIEDFYAKKNLNIYEGFDYSKKKYFSQIKNKKLEKYWSTVFLSTVDDEPSLSYSFKMKTKVVVIMIKLKELSNFIKRFRNHDLSHMIRLFDSSGVIILNPDNPQLFSQRYNGKTFDVYKELINKKSPYAFATFDSRFGIETQYGTYVNIPKTGWKIVIRESYDDILSAQKDIAISIVIAILFFIVISVFISFLISKKIFKELENFQKTTSIIANGDYKIKNFETQYKEFDNLLNSFNKMQEEIDKREDTLEASLESFKTLFNSTMEVIILHDHGRIIDLNDVAVKFFDLKDKEELLGENILTYIAPKDKELLRSNFERNTLPYEFEIVKKDGTIVSCLGRGQFIKLNGKILKLSTLIDITELKQKDRLLYQQSKMASMGEMIGNIAHQWRQPLSIISTCASGVKFKKEFEGISDKELYDSLDTIVESTKYLSKTIDDFRNFFNSDKKLETFNVSKSIKGSIELLKASLKNNQIHVDLSLDNLIEIDGYPNEFLQVLINIINNSKDAFVSNEIENRVIKINLFSLDDDTCIIEIEDCAGGIPESIINNIFDPYFTTKHKSKGTGIGLYMAHQIITNSMKGELLVKNSTMNIADKLYNGCTFTIELPYNAHVEEEYVGQYSI